MLELDLHILLIVSAHNSSIHEQMIGDGTGLRNLTPDVDTHYELGRFPGRLLQQLFSPPFFRSDPHIVVGHTLIVFSDMAKLFLLAAALGFLCIASADVGRNLQSVTTSNQTGQTSIPWYAPGGKGSAPIPLDDPRQAPTGAPTEQVRFLAYLSQRY